MNYRHLSSVVSALTLFLFLAGTAAAQSPVYQFAKQFPRATGGSVGVNASAADASGNIYVTGWFAGTVDFDLGSGTTNITAASAGKNIFLAKYDASGNYVWAFGLGGNNAPEDEEAQTLVIDGSGNPIIGGYINYGVANVDFDPGSGTAKRKGITFVAKYSPSKAFIWAFALNVPWITNLAVDGSGNVYTTGDLGTGTYDFDPSSATANLTASDDNYVAKYSSSGTYQWAKLATSGTGISGTRVVADASGNLFVSGGFRGTIDFDPSSATANLTALHGDTSNDAYVAKYTTSGAYLWAFAIPSTAAVSVLSRAHALDGSGNIVVTGYFKGTADFDPGSGTANLTNDYGGMYVAKYTSSGGYVSAFQVVNASAANHTTANQIALDGSDNIYVAGNFDATTDFDPGSSTANLTSNGNYDGFIAKYSSSGTYLWAFGLGSTGGDDAQTMNLSGTNVIVTGKVAAATTVDFDPGSGTANLTFSGSDSYAHFLAKYSQSGGTKESVRDDAPFAPQSEISVAPNPFTSGFSIRSSASAHVEVLDMSGNVVESAVTGAAGEVENLGAGLPSGTYFLRVWENGTPRQMMVQKIR